MKNIEDMKLKAREMKTAVEPLIKRHQGGDGLNPSEVVKIAEYVKLQNEIREEQQLQDGELIKANNGSTYTVDGEVKRTVKQDGSYRSLFASGIEPVKMGNSGFRSFGEFASVVASGKYDNRLDERQHLAGTGELGGFTIPTEHAGMLLDKSLESEIVRPRARVYPMKHSQLQIAKWNNNDHTAGLYGGLQGEWLAENATATIQEGALELVTLAKGKLAIFTEVSNELMFDSDVFEMELTSALSRGVGWYMDNAFINTDGTGGTPVGLLNDAALIQVARNTADQVDYDDLIRMYTALYKGGSPVWMVANDVLPQLLTIQDPANRYIWQADARGEVAGRLFGYPVIVTEKVPALGNTGDVCLADWSHYLIGLGPDITLEKNNAPGWARDVSSFRCIVRVNGVGSWSDSHTAANGNVVSWCVALD